METPNMITPTPDQQPIVPVKSGRFSAAKKILIFIVIAALIGGSTYYFLGTEGKRFKGLAVEDQCAIDKHDLTGMHSNIMSATKYEDIKSTIEAFKTKAESCLSIYDQKVRSLMGDVQSKENELKEAAKAAEDAAAAKAAEDAAAAKAAEDAAAAKAKCETDKHDLTGMYSDIMSATKYEDIKGKIATFKAKAESCLFIHDEKVGSWMNKVLDQENKLIAKAAGETPPTPDTQVCIDAKTKLDSAESSFLGAIGNKDSAKAEQYLRDYQNLCESKDNKSCSFNVSCKSQVSNLGERLNDLKKSQESLIVKADTECDTVKQRLTDLASGFDANPLQATFEQFKAIAEKMPSGCVVPGIESMIAKMEAAPKTSAPPSGNVCNVAKGDLAIAKARFDANPSASTLRGYTMILEQNSSCNLESDLANMEKRFGEICTAELVSLRAAISASNKDSARSGYTKMQSIGCSTSEIETQYNALMAGSGGISITPPAGGGIVGPDTGLNLDSFCKQKLDTLKGLLDIAIKTPSSVNIDNTTSVYNTISNQCPIMPEDLKASYMLLLSQKGIVGGVGGEGGTAIVSGTGGYVGFNEQEEAGNKLPSWGSEGEWGEGAAPTGEVGANQPSETGGMLKNLGANTFAATKGAATTAKKSAATGPEALIYLIFMAGSYGATRFIRRKK